MCTTLESRLLLTRERNAGMIFVSGVPSLILRKVYLILNLRYGIHVALRALSYDQLFIGDIVCGTR